MVSLRNETYGTFQARHESSGESITISPTHQHDLNRLSRKKEGRYYLWVNILKWFKILDKNAKTIRLKSQETREYEARMCDKLSQSDSLSLIMVIAFWLKYKKKKKKMKSRFL